MSKTKQRQRTVTTGKSYQRSLRIFVFGIPDHYLYTEGELEQRLIENVETFLLELG